MIPVIEDRVRLQTKREVLRLLLYTKLTEKGIQFSESELDVLMELHQLGGYCDVDQEGEFITSCITKRFRRSVQSTRNVVTKFVNHGVIRKSKSHQRFVSNDYLPAIEADVIGLMFFVSNAA